MKTLKKGIRYQVKDVKSDSELNGQIIEFSDIIELEGYIDQDIEITNGTNSNEVLDVLIDRMKFLNEKNPSRKLALTITKLEEASLWFNSRIRD